MDLKKQPSPQAIIDTLLARVNQLNVDLVLAQATITDLENMVQELTQQILLEEQKDIINE